MKTKKRMTPRQLIRFLRKNAPTELPVRVRFVPTEMDTTAVPHIPIFGDTQRFESYYRIRINKGDTPRVQRDTIIHEWAHCMCNWFCREDHSNEWALCYARIFRMLRKANIR